MKFVCGGGLGVAVFLLMAAPVAAQSDPSGTANGFLAVYGGFHPSDGIPDSAGRARLAPYFSPGLNKRLADAAAAQAQFAAKVKVAPPLLEGDIFSSLFEGATGWKLGVCSATGNAARCPVAFTHADAGRKPLLWTDTLILSNTAEGWRIDDIVYGGGFQFGNTGTLTETLKTVLSEAP
jgi:hypothetical protein